MEVTKLPKPSVERVALGNSASRQAVTRVNAEQAPKTTDVGADPTKVRGRPMSQPCTERLGLRSHRGNGDGMFAQGNVEQHEKPQRWRRVTANRWAKLVMPGGSPKADASHRHIHHNGVLC